MMSGALQYVLKSGKLAGDWTKFPNQVYTNCFVAKIMHKLSLEFLGTLFDK